MFYLLSDGWDHRNSKDMSRIPHFVRYECSPFFQIHTSSGYEWYMTWIWLHTDILIAGLITCSKFDFDWSEYRNRGTKHKYMVLIFVAFAINFVQPSQPKGGASYWSPNTNLLTKIHIRKQTVKLAKNVETNGIQSSDSIMLIARTPID